MSPKPTLVLIPGSWHSASVYDKVATLLEKAQYKCISVTLPSTSPNPSSTFLDDVEAARNAIVAETTQGRDVVVVVWSYGSIVGSSAIKGLTRHEQDIPSSGNKQSGHVKGLALISTGFAQTGSTFMEGAGGKPPPFWVADWESGFAVLVADIRQLFYHDLPEEEGNAWVAKIEKQSLKSLYEGGEHVYSGWKDVPVWYLATAEDKALPVEVQRMFVQMAKDAGADVTLREVASSHAAMLSRPREVADFLLEAVASFMG